MSEVDLYAVESKFNQAKSEYISLMNTLKTSCLGKSKTSDKCQKAAELNADMQTYLIQMSNLLKKTSTNLPKQQELLNLANQLDNDRQSLSTTIAERQDITVLAEMNYSSALTWALSAFTICALLVFQSRRNRSN